MIAVILIFSFLFEAIFTNIVSINSIFIPLFLLTSIVLVYPYFKNKKFNYLLVCIILGVFYDIGFSNTIFVNTISFGILSGIIMVCYNYVNYNIYTSNIINVIILITYRVLTYIMLLSINYISFNRNILLKGIYSSLLINIIYGIILYIIIDLLSKIFNKRKTE